MTTVREDPFDQLPRVLREALEYVSGRLERASQETELRGEQERRIRAAINVLSGEIVVGEGVPQKRKGKAWTPERKAAQSKLIKERLAAKAAAPLAPNESAS